MNKLFQTARQSALYKWLEISGRELLYSDDMTFIKEEVTNNYECSWQQKNWSLHQEKDEEDNHVSIFCSLNNWASHLSDLLLDVQFDGILLYTEPVREEIIDEHGEKIAIDTYNHDRLSRYYGRFFLVVSELLVDFGDIAKQLGIKDANKLYSDGNLFGYSEVKGFINNVFKHKTNNFHVCNHHIPLLFCDAFAPRNNYVKSGKEYLVEIGCSHDYNKKELEYILSHPRLIDVISFLAICYEKLDGLMTAENILTLAAKYGDKYSNSNK